MHTLINNAFILLINLFVHLASFSLFHMQFKSALIDLIQTLSKPSQIVRLIKSHLFAPFILKSM